MNKIYNYLILILATFLLTACQNSVLSDKSSSLVLNNEKAVILYSASVNGMLDSAGLGWTLVDDNGEAIEQEPLNPNEHIVRGLWSTALCADVVTPGKYDLTDIVHGAASGTQGTQYHLSVENLMGFSVKAGEIVYLGHIVFVHKDSNIGYRIVDRLSDDYETMQEMLPTLYTKIQKKLIK